MSSFAQVRHTLQRGSAGIVKPDSAATVPHQHSNLTRRLQRTAGNRAVEQMLSQDRSPEAGDAGRATDHLSPSTPSGGGAALPRSLQQRAQESIQSQFDFGGVRVHRDEARAARHNAAAYTVGTDVVLGREVGPLESPEGMRLLGHELAHVVQQSRGGAHTTPPSPGNPLEESADRAGQAFEAGRPSVVEGAARVGIARTPKSLGQTLVPRMLSDSELQIEIREIRSWLRENPGSSSDRNILEEAMAGLEDEVQRRQAPSAPAASAPPAAAPAAGCPTGMCHQPRPSTGMTLTPSMLPSTPPTRDEIELLRQWIESEPGQPSSGGNAPAAPRNTPSGSSRPITVGQLPPAPPPPRWVPIIQHAHLGTFGDTVVIVTAPWQGAVQYAPEPTAGYNFDTYITNPKTGALIPAQSLGGTRYRVFMGTPECPGCHFGRGLEVDILGENPILIFGPTMVMTGTQLLGARMFPPTIAEPPVTTPPRTTGWTPRVIQGGGARPSVPMGGGGPAFAGNAALELQPTVAQSPRPMLSLVPEPAPLPLTEPVPLQPPALLPNPALAALPAMASAGAPPQRQPVMPAGLSAADQQLWRTCNQQHNTYKATQDQAAAYAARMDQLRIRIMQNQATPQERLDFCALLDERIRLVQRLHSERQRYINLDCDRFDWFNTGTTAAERLRQHEIELENVSAQLRNFYELRNRLCL